MSKTNIIFSGIGFVAGALTSGITCWLLAKKKYEKEKQEEIDQIWNDLQAEKKRRNQVEPTATPDPEPVPNDIPMAEKPDLFEYARKIRESGYEAPEDLKKTNDLIHPIEYHELDEDNYERIDLTYYADGILADDGDYPIRSLDDTVSENFAEWMTGENADEILVRNEKRHIDYDICRSQLTYGEMLDRHPETEQRLKYDDALEDYYAHRDEDEDDEEEEGEEE